MLEAPALSARRVGTMLIPSAGAPTATEPSARACFSPLLPLWVYSLHSHAFSTTSARALLHHGLCSASLAPLIHLHLHTTHHTHTSPPATLAARSSSNARAPAETWSSCLRAAIASTSNLIGGIPRPLGEISVARVQTSASTFVVTSLYDHSYCCDVCSDRGLPAYLSACRRLPGRSRRERDLYTLRRG